MGERKRERCEYQRGYYEMKKGRQRRQRRQRRVLSSFSCILSISPLSPPLSPPVSPLLSPISYLLLSYFLFLISSFLSPLSAL